MTSRTRKEAPEKPDAAEVPATVEAVAEPSGTEETAAAATSENPEAPADPAKPTVVDEPAECIVDGCAEEEGEGLGVCLDHHAAGWRYVREPDNG